MNRRALPAATYSAPPPSASASVPASGLPAGLARRCVRLPDHRHAGRRETLDPATGATDWCADRRRARFESPAPLQSDTRRPRPQAATERLQPPAPMHLAGPPSAPTGFRDRREAHHLIELLLHVWHAAHRPAQAGQPCHQLRLERIAAADRAQRRDRCIEERHDLANVFLRIVVALRPLRDGLARTFGDRSACGRSGGGAIVFNTSATSLLRRWSPSRAFPRIAGNRPRTRIDRSSPNRRDRPAPWPPGAGVVLSFRRRASRKSRSHRGERTPVADKLLAIKHEQAEEGGSGPRQTPGSEGRDN